MQLDKIKNRVNELIGLSTHLLNNAQHNDFGRLVSSEGFSEFRSGSLSFIRNCFGENHPFYKEFEGNVKDVHDHMVEEGLGILKAVKKEIDEGWIFNLKSLLSAEIFSDFLQMSEYLLDEGYKDPAAVMTGSVLEEHLRFLCVREGIPILITKGASTYPKKADIMNAELCTQGAYNKLDQKLVTSWLDLRNKAAHGKYSEYSKEQVQLMQQGIANFIQRTT